MWPFRPVEPCMTDIGLSTRNEGKARSTGPSAHFTFTSPSSTLPAAMGPFE